MLKHSQSRNEKVRIPRHFTKNHHFGIRLTDLVGLLTEVNGAAGRARTSDQQLSGSRSPDRNVTGSEGSLHEAWLLSLSMRGSLRNLTLPTEPRRHGSTLSPEGFNINIAIGFGIPQAVCPCCGFSSVEYHRPNIHCNGSYNKVDN